MNSGNFFSAGTFNDIILFIRGFVNFLQDKTKGMLFGLCGMVVESLLPIISNSRPAELDPIYFSLWTMIFETILIYPVFLSERMNLRNQKLKKTPLITPISSPSITSQVLSPKRTFTRKQLFWISISIGIIFSITVVLQYWGYSLAGAIVGSIMLKSSLIFSILLGVFFLRETVTKRQIFYTVLLLLGLLLCMTNGFQTTFSVNIGAITLFFVPLLWMIGHSFTKLLLNNQIAPPMHILLNRISIGSVILSIIYLIFFPVENFALILNMYNFLWLALAGIDYALAHICWYSVLKYLPLSKSTVIYTFTPILSGLFAVLILHEIWNPIILIGMFIVIGSIFLIMQEKDKVKFSPN